MLLEERGVQFDALVAADDAMALGAMGALAAHGIRVPYDVAVAGFDDIEAARFANSPLTTVRQPLHDQGVYALQTVFAQSRGERVDPRVVLRTQLSVRQSCGCPMQTIVPLAQYAREASNEDLTATFAHRRRQIVQDLAQAMRAQSGNIEIGWGERLLDAFAAELRREPEGTFVSTFEEVLGMVAALEGDVSAWQTAVSVLRHHARACAHWDPEGWARAEDLWHQARVCVGAVAERSQAEQRLQQEQWFEALRVAGHALAEGPGADVMSDVLSAGLPDLKIPACHIALFEGTARPASQSQLLFSIATSGSPVASPGSVIDTGQLASGQVVPGQRRTTHFLHPLYIGREQLGFAVFEAHPRQGLFCEGLRDHVNLALESERLRRVPSQPPTRLDPQGSGPIRRARQDAEGLRVCTATAPAPEGAAEYCDVIPVDGACWLGIGEVAAPAPYARQVASVLRGAVSAICRHSPNAAPRSLVMAANAALFTEATRAGRRAESASLTLIRCDPSGRVVYAGAHQEIIVCRTLDGRCIRLPTSGTDLGAVRDIGRATVDTHCQLEEGDLLVLYSRSVAAATDEQGEPFGTDRLCVALQGMGREPVDVIGHQLLGMVRGHAQAQNGDFALLVARHGTKDRTLALDQLSAQHVPTDPDTQH
jgi:hypothetical protein